MKRAVVVGSGPAGLSAAATLDARDDLEVWLIDAGSMPISGPSLEQRWVLRGDTTRPCYLGGRGVGGGALVNAGLLGPDGFRTARIGSVPVSPGPVGAALRAAMPAAAGVRVLDGGLSSAAEAFGLSPPPNGRVELQLGAAVSQVLIDGSTACGVRTDRGEIEADLVVLAAGAIATPLLMVDSGIDTEGVGEGLCDHPALTVTFPAPRQHQKSATASGRGPQVSVVLELGDRDVAGWPDRHDDREDGSDDPVGLAYAVEGFDVVSAASDPPGPTPSRSEPRAGVIVALLRSERRGRVSRCPLTGAAVVDLGEFIDGPRLADLWRAVRPMFDTPQWSAFACEATVDQWGTNLDDLDSDEAVESWISRSAGGLFHAAGTCSRSVEADGRVRGYRRLYVADISRLPRSPAWPMLASLASGREVAERLRP